MPFANNEGINIHYQTEGDGPPVILQHWSLATLESWYDFGYVSGLNKDYRLILIDARGHGASDKPHSPEAYGLQERVKDIVTVLDDLSIDQAHFFGYSMGGWIGFGAAQYAPERFRSLIIGGQHPYAQKMDHIRQFMQYGIENGSEAFIVMWEENFGKLSNEIKERILNCDFEALLAVAQDRESLEAVLPTIRMPCLLYVGEKDDIYSTSKECAKHIANATFVTLPGLDHVEVIKRSDRVLPHVKRFLATFNH